MKGGGGSGQGGGVFGGGGGHRVDVNRELKFLKNWGVRGGREGEGWGESGWM